MNNNKRLRFLRLPDVIERVGLQTTRIRELESAGKFPKRIKISDRAVGWVEHEIDAWMEQRLANHGTASQSDAAVGEISREMETVERVRTDLHPSGGKQTKTQTLKDAGISTSAAGRCEQLADNPSPYLRKGEVMRLTGMSQAMIYDGVREKTFPKWVDRSKPCSGWLRRDVEAWLAAREAHTKKRSDE